MTSTRYSDTWAGQCGLWSQAEHIWGLSFTTFNPVAQPLRSLGFSLLKKPHEIGGGWRHDTCKYDTEPCKYDTEPGPPTRKASSRSSRPALQWCCLLNPYLTQWVLFIYNLINPDLIQSVYLLLHRLPSSAFSLYCPGLSVPGSLPLESVFLNNFLARAFSAKTTATF